VHSCRTNTARARASPAGMAGLLVMASAAAVRLLDEGLPDPGLTDVAVWAGVWAMAYCLLYLACKREGAEWAIHLHAFLHACVSLVGTEAALCPHPLLTCTC